MIHQLELTLLSQARKQRQLGVSRASLNQTAPRVITNPPHYRGTDTRRANDRVRILVIRVQHFLKSIKRTPRKHQRLLGITKWHAGIEFKGADNHDLSIVFIAIGCRAPGDAGVGSLADHNAVRRDARFQYVPKIE